MSKRITSALIDISSYKHNLDLVKSLIAKDVKIMAVVKANAYGHGIEEVARAASDWGVSYLGVVSVGELSRIRAVKINTPCLVLNFLDNDSIDEAISLDASVAVMDSQSIAALHDHASKAGKKIKIHIKVDTGMHRAGCEPDNLLSLSKKIVSSQFLVLEGIFTHFAESESSNKDFTMRQLSVLQSCLNQLTAEGIKPKFVHAANSAATIAYPASHFSMVRIGILSYGLSPFDETHNKSQYVSDNFRPVMSVKSKVIHIRQLATGESVGYCRRWTASRPSIVALVPIGYGDGYRRAPYNANYALINGHKVPVVGTVSMDQTVFDVTDAGRITVGAEVVLLGEQKNESISANDLAKDYQTINYEVVAAFTDRIERKCIPN